MREFEVEVHVAPETSVQEVSKVFEGLQSLADEARVALRYNRLPEGQSYPRVLRLSVRQGRESADVAIDLADQPALFHMPDLERADVYFKRSYWPDEVARLPEHLRGKLRPFGLNNPAIRPRSALQVLGARRGNGLSRLASDARQLLALPRPSAFQCEPNVPAEPRVFFQTQLWEPRHNGEEAEEINQERANLVLALRAAFGPRFMGGVIPTDFAKAHFPNLTTSLPSSMRAYPRLLRTPLIAIYSRGLHQSVAFKMSEYLAASRCIVGHRPTAELPAPLLDGSHFLGFSTADECIAQCEQLLARPNEAAEMRRANWEYYRANVEPSAHLLSILERTFEEK